MLEYIQNLDEQLLLFLNSKHSPIWDEVMLKATNRFFWIPFYILIGVFLIWKFRKKSLLLLLIIPLLIISADLFSSSLIKEIFGRLRPCHSSTIKDMLRLINGCGGQYGFISSHAANTFALTTFLILLLQRHYKYIYLLILWAALVSYSRMYLGVHYPTDILGGAIAGVALAFLFFKFYLWTEIKFFSTDKVSIL